MKKIFFSLLFASLSCACDGTDQPIPNVTYRSYIYGLMDITDIDVHGSIGFEVDEANRMIDGGHFWNVDTSSGNHYRISDQIVLLADVGGNFFTPQTDQKRHNELCEAWGDTNFNRTLPIGTETSTALTGTIDKIRIIVNEDYSPQYPAGSDVSALFIAYYEEPLAVVRNNYEQPADAFRFEDFHQHLPQAIYRAPVTESVFREIKALGHRICFLLTTPPAQNGRYTFTVVIETPDGLTVSGTSDIIPITI